MSDSLILELKIAEEFKNDWERTKVLEHKSIILDELLAFHVLHNRIRLDTDEIQTPKVTKEIPKVTKEIPKVTKEIPKVTKEIPKVTKKIPKVTKEIPKVTKEIPKVTTEIPKVTYGKMNGLILSNRVNFPKLRKVPMVLGPT